VAVVEFQRAHLPQIVKEALVALEQVQAAAVVVAAVAQILQAAHKVEVELVVQVERMALLVLLEETQQVLQAFLLLLQQEALLVLLFLHLQ
jgi:hypothetical protein